MIPIRASGNTLPDGITDLARIAMDEGFEMVQRLIDGYGSGQNDFSKPGESLWFVRSAESILAVGGLNVDPYYDMPGLGRIRHVYVHPRGRRSGIGSSLMASIESSGLQHFESFQLFTSNPNAARFYESLGYSPVVNRFKVSHEKRAAAG